MRHSWHRSWLRVRRQVLTDGVGLIPYLAVSYAVLWLATGAEWPTVLAAPVLVFCLASPLSALTFWGQERLELTRGWSLGLGNLATWLAVAGLVVLLVTAPLALVLVVALVRLLQLRLYVAMSLRRWAEQGVIEDRQAVCPIRRRA